MSTPSASRRKPKRQPKGKRCTSRAQRRKRQYWNPPRLSGPDAKRLVPCPFLSERGFALFVMRDLTGRLWWLLELEQVRHRAWSRWRDGGVDRKEVHDFTVPFSRHSIQHVAGPLFQRGVHLAPWTSQFGGRAFVAISGDHRLIAQSDCAPDESAPNVRALLAATLDIADPIGEELANAEA